jgi:hypothetical protein
MTAGPDEIRDPAPHHLCAFNDALARSGYCWVPVSTGFAITSLRPYAPVGRGLSGGEALVFLPQAAAAATASIVGAR